MHVCAYDRPGTVHYVDPPALTTRSTPVVQPRTLGLGGLVVHLYAQQHPDAVARLVFVDMPAPALEPLLGDQWVSYTRR